jgi:hypothetical protein
MKYDDFYDGLRLLSQLQRHELIHVHAFTEDDYQAWADFKRDPLRWLLRADDHRAAAVWAVMERGRKGRSPINAAKNSEHSELNVIQLTPRDKSPPPVTVDPLITGEPLDS